MTAVLEGPREAALHLAAGAADAAELRGWLEMTGLLPGPPAGPEPVPDGEKRCIGCREVKAVGEFYPDRSKPGGLMSYCKACSRARAKAWREQDGDGAKRQRDYVERLKAIGAEVPRGQFNVPLAVRVGQDLADVLKAEAAQAGVTVTGHIRGILQDHCDSQTAGKRGAA